MDWPFKSDVLSASGFLECKRSRKSRIGAMALLFGATGCGSLQPVPKPTLASTG